MAMLSDDQKIDTSIPLLGSSGSQSAIRVTFAVVISVRSADVYHGQSSCSGGVSFRAQMHEAGS